MKKIVHWQIGGFVFSVLLGVFFHFLFDLTNECIVVAFVAPVNESIGEHIKLVFFPMFLYALFEYSFLETEYEQFWCIKWKGISIGMILIPTIYYTYTGIIGKSVDWFNILSFVGVTGVVYFIETKMFLKNKSCRISSEYAFVILCIVGIVFWIFTFYPPNLPFFQDPISKTYGF